MPMPTHWLRASTSWVATWRHSSARKRSVFANVLRYAVELGELPSSPLDRLSWKPPKVSEVVDPRLVVNPRQARELITAVTYVGQYRRGPYARGQRLMAFYACMYFAALRPVRRSRCGFRTAIRPPRDRDA
jgi:hypothetical protein